MAGTRRCVKTLNVQKKTGKNITPEFIQNQFGQFDGEMDVKFEKCKKNVQMKSEVKEYI